MTLEELLKDPIVRLMMRRDGIDPHEIRALLEAVEKKRPAVYDHRAP